MFPPTPDYLPEMEDALIVKNTVKTLSPRIVAVHGPTGTGKSTVFSTCHYAMGRSDKGFETRSDSLCSTKTNPLPTIV